MELERGQLRVAVGGTIAPSLQVEFILPRHSVSPGDLAGLAFTICDERICWQPAAWPRLASA